MRTELDALLSLQRYVAVVLPDPWEIVTDLEDETPERPFALVTQNGDLTTGGTIQVPELEGAYTIHAYLPPTGTVREARDAAYAVRSSLWQAFAFGVGDGRPERVPLFDYGGRREVQRITLNATAGTWTVALGTDVTAQLAHPALAIELRAALEQLPSIGVGNVRVEGRRGGPYTITFTGELAGVDVATLQVDDTQLQGAATVDVLAEGSPGPWRSDRDFMAASNYVGRVVPDPDNPRLRMATTDVRLSWAAGQPIVEGVPLETTSVTISGR